MNSNAIAEGNGKLLNDLDNKNLPIMEEDYLRKSIIGFLTHRLSKLQNMNEVDLTIDNAIDSELLTQIEEHRLDVSDLLQVRQQQEDKRQNTIRLRIMETESLLSLFKSTNNAPSPLLQAKITDGADSLNKVLSGLTPRQMQLMQQFEKMIKSSDIDLTTVT